MRRVLVAVAIGVSSLALPAHVDAVSRCREWEAAAVAVGWKPSNVTRLSKIMWRESRCDPQAYNGRHRDRSYGLLQINTKVTRRIDLWSELQRRCGLTSRDQLFDPVTNLSCGLMLFRAYGWKPWRLG